MSIMITICTLSIILILFIAQKKYRKNKFWRSRGLPFKEYRFCDISLDIFRKPMFQINHEEYLRYGPVWGYFRGGAPALMITRPDLIQRILVKDAHLFVDRPEFQTGNPVLDSMLFVARGSQWKRIRLVVTPTLTALKLRSMLLLIDQCVKSALVRLEILMYKQSLLDLKHFWGLYTVDNIAKCFFGTDIAFEEKESSEDNERNSSLNKSQLKKKQKNKKSPFLRHIQNFIQVPIYALILFMHLPKRLRNFLGVAFFPKKSIQYFQQLLQHIVRRRGHHQSGDQDFLQYLIQHSSLSSPKNDFSKSLKDSTSCVEKTEDERQNVSRLLQRSVLLTEDEVLGQCMIFLIGAYDTTSTLLAWLSYRLALDQHIQEKVYRELVQYRRHHHLKFNEKLSYETLNSLEYINALINETLRFYPPFTMVERVANQDYPIPELNVVVPRGMEIGIPLYTMHHTQRYFSLPELFLPERFLTDKYLEAHQEEHAEIDSQLMRKDFLSGGTIGPFGVDTWTDENDKSVKKDCLNNLKRTNLAFNDKLDSNNNCNANSFNEDSKSGKANSVLNDFDGRQFDSVVELVRHFGLNQIKPYTFLAFGAGPRSCIGRRFALLNVLAALTEILIRYRLVCNEQTRFPPSYKTSLSFTLSDDLMVGIEARESMDDN